MNVVTFSSPGGGGAERSEAEGETFAKGGVRSAEIFVHSKRLRLRPFGSPPPLTEAKRGTRNSVLLPGTFS